MSWNNKKLGVNSKKEKYVKIKLYQATIWMIHKQQIIKCCHNNVHNIKSLWAYNQPPKTNFQTSKYKEIYHFWEIIR